MQLKEGDFIEIEFTGKIKDGEIFDSNVKEDLEKLHQGHNHEIQAKPLIFCLGKGMFLKSLDNFLIGKDLGDYSVELSPEDAFGNRTPSLIQKVPINIFTQQKLNPYPGAVFNFDGRIAKVLTISGGRVIVDFNSPLAGKTLTYKIRIIRKIEDLNEKIKAVIDFLFNRELEFEVKEEKLIIKAEKPIFEYVPLYKDKVKELLNLELEAEEIPISNNKPQ